MVPTNVTVHNNKELKKYLNIYTLRKYLSNLFVDIMRQILQSKQRNQIGQCPAKN